MDRIILGLDVSTTTVGVCLYNATERKLIKLTQITPKPKKTITDKTEILFKKADIVSEFLSDYKDYDITDVVIEEPLLGSNNIYTVAVLLRFNGIISKNCYDMFGTIPEYISTYDSRAIAFPDLLDYRIGKSGKPGKNKVLFGSYPTDVDKKRIIWEKVSKLEPQVVFPKNKNGQLDKRSYDSTDAYCVTRAYCIKNNIF